MNNDIVKTWQPETPSEKAKRIGVPLIEPIKPYPGPNQTIAVCGKCGLELKQVMGYCCPNADCPCGMGPVMSLNYNAEQMVDIQRMLTAVHNGNVVPIPESGLEPHPKAIELANKIMK